MGLAIFTCKRCGKEFVSKFERPKRCGKCKSRVWDKAKREEAVAAAVKVERDKPSKSVVKDVGRGVSRVYPVVTGAGEVEGDGSEIEAANEPVKTKGIAYGELAERFKKSHGCGPRNYLEAINWGVDHGLTVKD